MCFKVTINCLLNWFKSKCHSIKFNHCVPGVLLAAMAHVIVVPFYYTYFWVTVNNLKKSLMCSAIAPQSLVASSYNANADKGSNQQPSLASHPKTPVVIGHESVEMTESAVAPPLQPQFHQQLFYENFQEINSTR